MKVRGPLCSLVLLLIMSFPLREAAGLLLPSGKVDETLAALQARIQANPGDAEAHSLMSRVYLQIERWDEAIRAAEKAVKLMPDNSEYHQWLGRAYGLKAEVIGPIGAFSLVRKVKAEFERAVNLSADNLSARADLAEFYTEAPSIMGGDKTKARQLADYVGQRDPAQGHYMRARIEEKRNKADAERELKAAIAESHNSADYWIDLAAFYVRSGRFDEMQATVERAQGIAPHDPNVLFTGGSLLLRGGRNFSGAVQMLRSYIAAGNVIEDGPLFQAHYVLGQLLEKQGNSQDAANEFRAALALASQYKPAQDALARVSR